PQNDVTLKMPAFEWVHVQLHQQKGMISLSPPTICNSAFYVAPDEAKKRALKIIFDSIASVIVKNQHVQLEAKHRDVFRFYTLDELKNLELDNYA
ncbi:hypothetical protein ACTF0A_28925, partial [Klebsiella pneumoniae]